MYNHVSHILITGSPPKYGQRRPTSWYNQTTDTRIHRTQQEYSLYGPKTKLTISSTPISTIIINIAMQTRAKSPKIILGIQESRYSIAKEKESR